jgi:hypothetical protein
VADVTARTKWGVDNPQPSSQPTNVGEEGKDTN